MTFIRYLVVSAIIWLTFIAGYLCRDVLGDWLLSAHTGSLWDQICLVSTGVFRVFLTFVFLAVTITVCLSAAVVFVGVLQEVWYQVIQRRIIAVFMRRREQHQEELRRAAEEDEDDNDIGAPKESVSARKHARRGREGTHNQPRGTRRMQQLMQQAEADREVESLEDELANTEIKVKILT